MPHWMATESRGGQRVRIKTELDVAPIRNPANNELVRDVVKEVPPAAEG